jgi:hypothetical protein
LDRFPSIGDAWAAQTLDAYVDNEDPFEKIGRQTHHS